MPSAFANNLKSGVLNPQLDDYGRLAEEQRSCSVVAANNNTLEEKERNNAQPGSQSNNQLATK